MKKKSSYSRRRLSFKKNKAETFFTKQSILKGAINGVILPLIRKYDIQLFVDSSCGDGSLVDLLDPIVDTLGFDLSPCKTNELCKTKDWFKVKKLPNTNMLIGFNPPFGLSGSLAKKFIEHAISFKPKAIVMILPFICTTMKFNEYSLASMTQLPDNAFYVKSTGKDFCYPTFLCTFVRSIEIIPQEPIPLPRYILESGQYKNEPIQGKNVVLVKRIGHNCGKHGFVKVNNVWYEYRYAKITLQKEEPVDCPKGAFIFLKFSDTTPKTKLLDTITRISDYREHIRYKRTISAHDIAVALE